MMDWIFERFNALFGWLLSLGMGGKLDWVARDWLNLVLLIVILGVILDLAVYFVRYRPDRAWRRFFSKRSRAVPHPSGNRAAPARDKPLDITVNRPAPSTASTEQATGIFRMPARPAGASPTRAVSPAERFQPAPPREGYDAEPTTLEPRTGTPRGGRKDPE